MKISNISKSFAALVILVNVIAGMLSCNNGEDDKQTTGAQTTAQTTAVTTTSSVTKDIAADSGWTKDYK